MATEQDLDKWSVVMTGFQGDWWLFKRTAESVFGRQDLDAHRLCTDTEEHLPAELAHNIDIEEATLMADQLREAGADVTVIPSSQLPQLRHTAAEIWATRCIGEWSFIEVDGLVAFGNSLMKRDILAGLSDGHKWQKERALNHDHATDADILPDQAAKQVADYVAELTHALQQAFPGRAFTIACSLGYAVSFWQTTEDSPRKAEYREELIFIGPVTEN